MFLVWVDTDPSMRMAHLVSSVSDEDHLWWCQAVDGETELLGRLMKTPSAVSTNAQPSKTAKTGAAYFAEYTRKPKRGLPAESQRPY